MTETKTKLGHILMAYRRDWRNLLEFEFGRDYYFTVVRVGASLQYCTINVNEVFKEVM